MAQKYYEGEVYRIIEETENVRRFFFRMPDDLKFTFRPGQFVMLNLPIDSKVTNRSYSIASAPNEENTFELIIVLKRDGKGTTFLWEKVTEGMKLQVSMPLGKFVLPEKIETDLCLVCTGTGIAPFRSMVQWLHEKQVPHRNIWLIFGTRVQGDILYRKELTEMESRLEGFKFIPVLSREDWKGEKGYVHGVYEKLFADGRPAVFYLCGWKEMLKEARERISKLGYDRSVIRFETYD